jgi:hypothetical protein
MEKIDLKMIGTTAIKTNRGILMVEVPNKGKYLCRTRMSKLLTVDKNM